MNQYIMYRGIIKDDGHGARLFSAPFFGPKVAALLLFKLVRRAA
jgi:hypothetical protein